MKKETRSFLILGASENEQRYSNMAVRRLSASGYEIIAVGKSGTEINGVTIHRTIPEGIKPHTVLMYIAPQHQIKYQQAIIDLKPEKIIFNPGTENREFAEALTAAGIQVVESCALVLHSIKKI
jgi:hypothetical protein